MDPNRIALHSVSRYSVVAEQNYTHSLFENSILSTFLSAG